MAHHRDGQRPYGIVVNVSEQPHWIFQRHHHGLHTHTNKSPELPESSKLRKKITEKNQ
jgi:hypothetical protein